LQLARDGDRRILIPLRRSRFTQARLAMTSDEEYEIDPQGYRVLIGLTIGETEEFFRLDAVLATKTYSVEAPPDDTETPEAVRWMQLLDKHDMAMMPFRNMHSSRH
jgi:hypothetical protein